ncbi:Transglutaminase-like superfamily protein [Streptomyces sp. yr375]|uniref:lasso peptide biosynthesis B2 protein n=1 Tax=Streptomyces sp. yr375 TaxID=1761906 RepID=UPI0008AD1D8C|nr:lasso peptide biosynthesis B2 protein [Streptomyces sp. yr375]SER60949.1 Transglutaminase-like superfamily protein [Streptomyces sp. yr375]
MTLPMTLEPRTPLPLHRRPLPLLAVAAGRLLGSRSPHTMERALRRLARGARPATHAEALRARDDIVSVSRRAAGQYCLERSVATAILARLHGSWPDWVSGVCLVPFAAHAWVEVDGKPVGESLRLDAFRKNIVIACPHHPTGKGK